MFNDVSHLGPVSKPVQEALDSGTAVLALIRHGRTKANVEQRWQGRGNWGLDELGHRQAEALSEWYGQRSLVYSSPLDRAVETAGYVASSDVTKVEDLAEISMGEWENLTTEEIVDRWGPLMEAIFRDGVDLKRGVTGESFGELRARVANAISQLDAESGETTVVVSHGGAIRSYVSGLTQTTDSHGESLLTPRNTSVTHVALTERGPEVLDYGVAPHLDQLT
jgi:broad specificity phosphatase PhoE